MAHYGEIIDQSIEPKMDAMYKAFTTYFSDPLMTKLKDVDDYSVYIAKADAHLGVEFRYIFVFIPRDEAHPGTSERMSNLRWISLQTRTLKDNHQIPIHPYIPRRLPELNKKIKLTFNDEKQYRYEVEDFPITVTLLPTNQRSEMEYAINGNLIMALETYQTIITVQ